MSITTSDITPHLSLLTGSVLSPGNGIHIIGLFRTIDANGQVWKDNVGPVRAYLVAKPEATSPVRSHLSLTCTPEGVDGRWNLTMPGGSITANVMQAFAEAKVAYIVVEQGTLTRVCIKLTCADGKPAFIS